jgi:photosystem II stability/assembly factor-like uncharacterized protein
MKKLLFTSIISLISFLGISQTNWYPQTSGTNTYFFDVHFTDQDNGWLCGNTGLIMHTIDGGASWMQQDAPPVNAYYGIHFTDSQNGWACGYGGQIIRTTDGGTSWIDDSPITNTFLYDIFFIGANTGWVVGGDHGTYPSFIEHRKILFTNDGGITWTAQISESYENPLRSVHFVDQYYGYAAGEAGTILQTSDGGNTWNSVMGDPFYEFTSIYAVDDLTAYVTGIYLGLPHVPVIFKTMDGGSSWTSQTFTQDESLADIYFADEYNGWAVGGTTTSATILRTNDGGETWYDEEPGTNHYLTAVCIMDASSGWATGANGTVIAIENDIFTGIEDQVTAIDVNVYPNPASDRLTITLDSESEETANIYIVNSLGQVVYSGLSPSANSNNTHSINTSGFVRGLYTVVIENGSESISEKVIVM